MKIKFSLGYYGSVKYSVLECNRKYYFPVRFVPLTSVCLTPTWWMLSTTKVYIFISNLTLLNFKTDEGRFDQTNIISKMAPFLETVLPC